ncbi:MAG: hypothetical protein QOC63_1204 [Mycobacterium sp.]|jgi:hypothetical protein|nr:hypothetical protein [Mycobacterium sp.]
MKSMGFTGSGASKKFCLDYLNTWRASTVVELPERRGAAGEPVLPARIQGHDCHVYEYTESALQQLPPHVDYHGYARRYKAFRWWPNRPTIRETKSRGAEIPPLPEDGTREP